MQVFFHKHVFFCIGRYTLYKGRYLVCEDINNSVLFLLPKEYKGVFGEQVCMDHHWCTYDILC